MKHRWAVWLTIGLGALVGAAGAPARAVEPGAGSRAAAMREIGRWTLDETGRTFSNTAVTPAVADGSFPARSAHVPLTVRRGRPPVLGTTGTSFYFPGWKDKVRSACPGQPAGGEQCDTVSVRSSLATIAGSGKTPGTVGSTGTDEPWWSVSLDLRADRLALEATVADRRVWNNLDGAFGRASPNLLQQGLAAAKGQWKVSQEPVSTFRDPRGYPGKFYLGCTFQGYVDGNTNVLVTRSAKTSTALKVNTGYRAVCELLDGARPRITVYGSAAAGAQPVAVSPLDDRLGVGHTYRVAPDDVIAIGKKYGARGKDSVMNHANDAFAGSIDTIVISSRS